MRRSTLFLTGALGLSAVVGCARTEESAAESQDHAHPEASADGGVPLYDNLGSHGRQITTSSAEAQRYFDQGLRLEYAFNHAEAIRSYQAALEHDPNCAMCWWGIALASGPNINGGMDAESGRRAYEAIGRARQLAPGDGVHRSLIEALATRYGADPEADRAKLDSAFAVAMAGVARRFPQDDDVLTLHAAALMNLRPWDYWSGEYEQRRPNPGTETIVATLERALQIDANNPGACHYYIHAVEAAFPKKAEPCADRLAELMPGAGHIVHMPAHIYIRVGRWADAVAANEHAVHSDETYIADQSPTGVYPSAYYPHNYHFMAFAATMAGMSAKAFEAAEIVAPKVPKEIAMAVPFIQNAVVFPHLTGVTFGRWDRVLELPMPDPDLHVATSLVWYARGVAHAAKGDLESAKSDLDRLTAVVQRADPEGANAVMDIARHALMGEIALRSGKAAEATLHFGVAAEREDGMTYEEPPLWYYPIRHSLGVALLAEGKGAQAERAYREDLARFPQSGWALYGLAKSLEAQGKDATAAWAAFREAWKDADVELTASRF